MKLLYLDPQALEADPNGVREEPGDVAGLAATIAEYGLLQPLGVTEAGQGRYRVVYGNRRREAALSLGLERVPCIIIDADDPQMLIQQVTENVQRQDLNDLEKARAFARLRETFTGDVNGEGELDEATARTVGLSARQVRRYLGLLDLPQEIQNLIRGGELSVTQAQHLRRIPNQRTQIELAHAAIDEGMSAAELSRLSSYFAANPQLSLDDALSALQQGVELKREIVGQPVAPPSGGPLGKTSTTSVSLDGDNDDDLWDDEDEVVDDGEYLSVEDETLENQPKNKARVFRIRSLDQMLDETDRLSRAHVDGDIVKWVKSDTGAPMKVRLLLKQLDSLSRALRQVADEQGWQFDE